MGQNQIYPVTSEIQDEDAPAIALAAMAATGGRRETWAAWLKFKDSVSVKYVGSQAMKV